MTAKGALRLVAAGFLWLAIACTKSSHESRYLYVWAGDQDAKDSDFLMVIDAQPSSATYTQVVATVPVGMSGSLPHHLEYWLPDSTSFLFANGHHHEQVFLFDIRDAAQPKLVRAIPTPAPFRFPHDMVRLPGGRELVVGYLRSDGPSPLPGDTTLPGGHGGIARVSEDGAILATASAADSAFRVPIRPYSFAFRPDIDRMLVTSAPMMEDTSADVIQVWRLSSFELLSTTQVPQAMLLDGTVQARGKSMPFEPRVMPDGSILFNAFGCGFYRVTGLDRPRPEIHNVYTIPIPDDQLGACGIPVVAGHFWIMAVGTLNALVALDVRDPASPREVARLQADSTFRPHWLARDPLSNRIVVGAENGGESRMLMARLDERTGRLAWDSTFRSSPGVLGVTFVREEWPHGKTGEAFGHAALFRP